MLQPDSCAYGMDNLQLFQVPPTNIALEDSKWEEYYPISSTLDSETAPIEFEIKGQGDQYLDLSQTYLKMVCQFVQNDGSDLAGDPAKTAPVNNILHSLFTEIDVNLNGKIITPGTDTYPYKAYLEKLLSYKPRTLATQMKACSLWEKDTAGHMDKRGLADLGVAANQNFAVAHDTCTINKPIIPAYPANSKNEGYRKRHEAIDASQEAQSDKFHLIETGNLRVEVQFTNNTATTLNCVVYAELDNILEINKERENQKEIASIRKMIQDQEKTTDIMVQLQKDHCEFREIITYEIGVFKEELMAEIRKDK
ncbi:uncharacterized protein F54H12.2-like [Saccostrea echinata]|uniref:uncharacterized protein F54H12.2-like n=1 Tax=Saccostrea echinata TaxID=191078 RepID=UPI002A838338|nr:uncharacterized protein F54H12.2-like [Saccostrea echinata]